MNVIVTDGSNIPIYGTDTGIAISHNCSTCRCNEDCTADEKDYGTQHDNNDCYEDDVVE